MANDEIKYFGRQLRALREKKGFSQEEFAHLVNVDRSYLGGVERGERNPTLKFVYKICAAIDIQPEELFK